MGDENSDQHLRIGKPNHCVELRAANPAAKGHTVEVTIRSKGLTAVWTTDFPYLAQNAQALMDVYNTMTGEVVVGDDESIGIVFTIDASGHVRVAVTATCWQFGLEGELRFAVMVDQTYLPGVATALQRLRPSGVEGRK